MSRTKLTPDGSVTEARSLLRHAVWIFVALLAATFLILAVISEVGKLPKISWDFSPGWLALALVALMAFQGIHAEAWRRILHDLHGDIPARKGWAIWNVSLLARYVPSQLLLVVTRVGMCTREGVPRKVSIASIAYEIALVTAASFVVAAWGFTELPALKGDVWRWAIFIVPVAAVVCLHPRVFSHLSARLLRRLGSDELPRTLSVAMVVRLGAVYIASFVIVGIGVLCLARSLHSVDPADLPLIISAWSVGYAAALVAFFIPGGLGVREGAVAAVLAVVLPTGVAIAVAVAIRLAQTGIELLYAGASVLYARRLPELSDARKAEVSASDSGVPIS
jgi:Lysylphosphatidylglycerol synthase TM region